MFKKTKKFNMCKQCPYTNIIGLHCKKYNLVLQNIYLIDTELICVINLTIFMQSPYFKDRGYA